MNVGDGERGVERLAAEVADADAEARRVGGEDDVARRGERERDTGELDHDELVEPGGGVSVLPPDDEILREHG